MAQVRDTADIPTTEYQETVVDPNIGIASQVQCAGCGSWRPNSRLYCPACGERNVLSESVFLTEEELLAKSGLSAAELKATIREPAKERRMRRLWLLLGFAVLLSCGAWWAHEAREEALQNKQQENLAKAQAAEAQQKAQADAAAAEQAKAAASAAQAEQAAATAALAAASAAADAAAAAASSPIAIMSDDQATKLGLATPAPKRKAAAASAPVAPAPPQPAVAVAPTAAPEPPKPEPATPAPAPRVETPMERLASALTACRGRGGFFERNACEFNARKQYCPGLEGSVRDCPVQRNDL